MSSFLAIDSLVDCAEPSHRLLIGFKIGSASCILLPWELLLRIVRHLLVCTVHLIQLVARSTNSGQVLYTLVDQRISLRALITICRRRHRHRSILPLRRISLWHGRVWHLHVLLVWVVVVVLGIVGARGRYALDAHVDGIWRVELPRTSLQRVAVRHVLLTVIIDLRVAASMLECSTTTSNHILLTSDEVDLRILLVLLQVSILIKLHILLQYRWQTMILSSLLELIATRPIIRTILPLPRRKRVNLLPKIVITASNKPSRLFMLLIYEVHILIYWIGSLIQQRILVANNCVRGRANFIQLLRKVIVVQLGHFWRHELAANGWKIIIVLVVWALILLLIALSIIVLLKIVRLLLIEIRLVLVQ